MKAALKRCCALVVALMLLCASAGASDFNKLLGIAEESPLPDLELTLEAVAVSEEAPAAYPGTCTRYDYPDSDAMMPQAEAFYEAMLALGYEASSVTVDHLTGIRFDRGDAWVVMAPDGDQARLYLVLAADVTFTQQLSDTPGETAVMPIMEDQMGRLGVGLDQGETDWGYAMDFWWYEFGEENLCKRYFTALKANMTAYGWHSLHVTLEGEWGVMFAKNGAHVLAMPAYGQGAIFIGVEVGGQIVQSGDIPADNDGSQPSAGNDATNAPAPTAVPESTAAPAPSAEDVAEIPSFAAFTGWTPAESGSFGSGPDGTAYVYEIFYGYDRTLALEYMQLLADGGFDLTPVSLCYEGKTEDGGTVLETTLRYTGSAHVGEPAFPDGATGENCHLYMVANETQNVGLMMIRPETLPERDLGNRFSGYGLPQGQPVPTAQAQEEQTSSGVCALCGGNGVCYKCSGSGVTYTVQGKQTCAACDGSGVCKWCRGTGVY